MPTLHTTTYTSVFSGQNVGPAFPQYNSFSIGANTELSWPNGFQNLNPVIAVNMDISATAGGFTVKMPDAEGAGTGYAFKVNNPGAFSFNLIDNDNNLIVAVPNGTAKEIWLIDNSTTAGVWRTFPNPGGGSAVTSINATSSSNNLVVTGVPGLPITGAGTIQFALANDLSALTSFASSTGIAVRTAANTWALRSIAQGTSIEITNPSGIAGNMIIALSNILTDLVSVEVGNLFLAVNTISSTNNNGNIILTPHGTGKIQLSKDTEILSDYGLKFYAPDAVHYISFKANAMSVNQDLFWPTTAPTNGQVLSHSALGQLQWASVPTTGGGTTILHSLARYSNTGGGLTDSIVILDDVGNMTGIVSAQINNILLGSLGAATITTQITNQDLTFSPNGLGAVISKTDVSIRKSAVAQSKLRLYNALDNFYAGIMANPSMAADFTWTLPIAGNTAGYFVTDNTNSMSIRVFPTTVVDNVPKFSDTTGSLAPSSLSITAGGAGTGLASCTFGNISVSVTANTIANTASNTDLSIVTNGTGKILLKNTVSTDTNTNLTLSPNGTGVTVATTDLSLLLASTQLKLRLYNSAGTFYTGIQAGAAAANNTFTLPIVFPGTPGILKCSTAGVISTDALAAAAGPLRADAAGVITVNNLTTNDNSIPRFDGTAGLFQTSGLFVDDNDNLLVAGSISPTTGTRNITIRTGIDTTAVAASHLSIGCKNSGGSDIVLFLYGSGAGGVSASTTNTVTNKIAIYVNGTKYFLLASTSGT